MKSKKILSLLLTGAMTAALLAVHAQAAEIPQPEPYTISADHWSREDFSQEANPSVFTGVYSRELYNTIRQTMVDGTSDTAPHWQSPRGSAGYVRRWRWGRRWHPCQIYSKQNRSWYQT